MTDKRNRRRVTKTERTADGGLIIEQGGHEFYLSARQSLKLAREILAPREES